ncbi:TonB-dependent receptor plug domain-containing protein [Campylobacter troglodytis]|uniref:TonB-dependent receptor plug domain-containing protein n=1 Tax=Campylobacter troglodytis TaxID=654363 RepID=UPI0011592ECD|nr:TonB-dependent receptor plug domain-containing protein [Campylobacter troglodytis]TQR60743.1 TonB-dependent receptor [Campylobacter troglodytis]
MKRQIFISLVAASFLLAQKSTAQTPFNKGVLLANNETNSTSSFDTSYQLEATTIEADINPTKYYQSGSFVGKSIINSAPNGNGDITSALKILPNVQFDNAQLSSHSPGEIDPANISISGGLFYQNNFQLDGFNMNNDLDPVSNATGGTGGASQGLKGGRSQGFNIDTSLLESITVQDSNIGAAYGGFTGGVVEAQVRNPRRDGWHFDLNYQRTSDKWTKYHITEEFEENLANSTDEKFQPKFTKDLIKASVEGWVNDRFGVIGAFSTTRSKIPLNGYSTANQYNNPTEAFGIRNQTRRSDNYYLKTIYNVTDSFSLEGNFGYMPQFNSYFSPVAKDSFYTMQSGGYQAGLKALWDTSLGLWSNQIGYSFLENSRKSDKNYFLTWRHSADDKNWASTSSGYTIEGGVSDVDQIQQSLNYKSDMNFELSDFFKIRVGGEFDYKYVAREVVRDYYYNTLVTGVGYTADLNGAACGGADLFGVPLCSQAPTTASGTTALTNAREGQFIRALNLIPKGSTKLDVSSYAFYLENEFKVLDHSKLGLMTGRFGLRFDGDDYMDKSSVAPRFSLAYIAPWKDEGFDTRLTFGANRYYGRNLFSYRLYDSILAATKSLTRADLNSPWVESAVAANSSFKFNTLDIPYSDEVMVGLSQDLWALNFSAKYIKREGKDEIVQRRSTETTAQGGYAARYSYYTNEGSSKSDIVSLTLENVRPLQTLNVNHHFLLAFDYSDVKRSYNQYSVDENYIEDPDILYDGKVIKYSERPTENFARPYTLRLSTTQTMKMGPATLLLNNFFRYRSGYDRMVLLNRLSANYDANIGTAMSQYGKHHFKGAFNWDMRVGLEMKLSSFGTFYTNVDIINVLNKKNETTISGANGNMAVGGILSASASYPVYDVGRQFWLQVGYKY